MEEKFRTELLAILYKKMGKEQISEVDMALSALFAGIMWWNSVQIWCRLMSREMRKSLKPI